MPDFATRLAQRGAGLRPKAAPRPNATPWAAARLGGPSDIVIAPEPGTALHPMPAEPMPLPRPTLAAGPAASAPTAVTQPAANAETHRPPAIAAAAPSAPLPGAPSFQPRDALSTPYPRAEMVALAHDDHTSGPPAAKAAPAVHLPEPNLAPTEAPAVPLHRKEGEPDRKLADAPASPPPQVSSRVNAAAPGQTVPVLALPQSARPSIAAMPSAAAPEMRPIQVRIGRVEVRATPPAATPGPRPRAGAQGFGAMHMARSWLGRSFY
ncbi:MAG TPA: hypothetical protein VGR45_05030 [Stellaceae bacterium]|nr:hypothetical protein [Stellaceae bacterium]